MTDQEKKQQRANLVIEIEDAQGDFVHLRDKALSFADALEEIAGKVRANANRRPSRDDFTPDSELASRLRPEHQAVLSFEEIGNLIEELRATRKKLFNLAERKAQFSSPTVTIPFD